MAKPKEQLLFENEAFRLTSRRLEEQGLTAELLSPDLLVQTKEGQRREIPIPPVEEGETHYRGSIPVLEAMFRLSLAELKADTQAGGLMLAGASWSTVWTRDIAYAAALGAALAAPEACRASLASRVRDGVILQDTGTGGGWPISTDRVSWALGAWALYLSTGDKEWLDFSAEALMATLAQDEAALSRNTLLYPGETSFMDWREQSYPDWMDPALIGASYAFGTNVLHYIAHMLLARMLKELGRANEAAPYAEKAADLSKAIQNAFWSRATRQYGMMKTPDGCLDERTDALATALAVLSGLAGSNAARAMENLPRSPWGTPVFAPYKSAHLQAYHNRAIWPFVEAYVLLAHADMQDTQGAARSMACLLRAAMAFGTNKENFHAETGRAEDTIQNSDRQLWSVAGMLGMFYYGLFGIQYEHDNLVFAPCVPRAFAGDHWLTGLRIRKMVLDVHLNGYGTDVCSVLINGKAGASFISLDTEGHIVVEIGLMPAEENLSMPQYPVAEQDLPAPEWDAPTAELLRWRPVTGATSYRIYANGTALAHTAACTYAITHPAPFYNEYRVQACNATASSCLSRPWECPDPGARLILQPARIGEESEYAVEHQQAWLDTSPHTSHLDYETATLAAGRYSIRIRYCNATASLRDSDTCALRELFIDGEPIAIIPLPHNTEAGQWDHYTMTAPVHVTLPAGLHRFSLHYTAACENFNGQMNQCMVRYLEITRR